MHRLRFTDFFELKACEFPYGRQRIWGCIVRIVCISTDFLELKTSVTSPSALRLDQAVLVLHSLGVDQAHDASTDLAQPMSQALDRDRTRIRLRGGDPEQELLERHRSPVIGRRGARFLDDACGQVGRIETEPVIQPEAEELADAVKHHVFVTDTSMLMIGSGSPSQTSGLRTIIDQAA